MSKTQIINFRVSQEVAQAFNKYCEDIEVKPSEVLRNAIKDILDMSEDDPKLQDIESRVSTLEGKLRALEGKFEIKRTPKPERAIRKPSEIEGDLITIDQIVELTGYAKSTLSSKMSRLGIQAVDRINGNRGGLYSKEEVLSKLNR